LWTESLIGSLNEEHAAGLRQGVGIRRLAARPGGTAYFVGRAKRRTTHNGKRAHRPSDARPATEWIADSPQAGFVRTSGTANK